MRRVFTIALCPKCHQEVDPDAGYHEHGDIAYPMLDVRVCVDEPHFGQLVANACRDAEEAHAEAEAERAADKAELAAMEAEWRLTASPEQIERFERLQRTRRRNMAAFSDAIREVWGAPSVMHSLNSPSPLFVAPEEVARHAEENRRLRRVEAQRVIDRFEREGPASVSFAQLRRARRELEELS